MLRHPSITGRRSAAFTLVELLVVISIIIILLAVSIPTIRAADEEGLALRRSSRR